MRFVFGRGIGIRHLGAILGLLAVAAPSAAMAPALIAAPMVHVAVATSVAAAHSQAGAKDAGAAAAFNAQVDVDAALAARLDELRSKAGSWEWADLIERGRIAIGQGDFGGATAVFETATQCAPDDAARAMTQYCWAMALIAKAQSLPQEQGKRIGPKGYLPRGSIQSMLLQQAGNLLNSTQRMAPASLDVAGARVAAWALVGDALETAAAEHHARVLDPQREGTPRCELLTMGVIAFIVCIGGKYALETFSFDGYLEPHQRLKLLELCDSGARVTGGIMSGGTLIEVFAKELIK